MKLKQLLPICSACDRQVRLILTFHPALKKGKGDDDLRFQGTILGKETEPQPTVIIGGDATLKEFMDRYRTKIPANLDEDDGSSPGESSMLSSAPATPGESADAVDTPAPSADTTETAAATPSALPA